MMVLLYVDDMFLTGEDELIEDAKRRLDTDFEMKYLGMMHYLLGMEACQSADGIFLGQGKYTMENLKRFKKMEYKAITTPMESNLNLMSDASFESVDAMMCPWMIGYLMYLMSIRPDIFFAVNTLN